VAHDTIGVRAKLELEGQKISLESATEALTAVEATARLAEAHGRGAQSLEVNRLKPSVVTERGIV
jgi:hypothetical protein